MTRYLRMEWLKYRKSRLLYLLLLLFILLLYSLSNSLLGASLNINVVEGYLEKLRDFPDLWFSTAAWSNYLLFFLFSFWTVQIISGEFRQKTLRQSVISGLKRQEFFLMKLAHLVVVSLLFSLAYLLVALIMAGKFDASFSEAFPSGLEWFLRHFLLAMIYGAMAMLVATWVKSAGLAFIGFLSYFAIERLLRAILGFLSGDILDGFEFWPSAICNQLAPNFIMRFGEGLSEEYGLGGIWTTEAAFLAGIVLLLLLLAGLYQSLMRRDL